MTERRLQTVEQVHQEGNRSAAESTIKLLIGEQENRLAVRDLLEPIYAVDVEQSVGDADLYIVDDRTLPQFRQALLERVEQSDPVFCPVVLVRREDSSIQVTLPAPGTDDDTVLVDDIVDAPLDRERLFRRIDTLLVRRRQSLDLLRYVERLEDSNRSLEQFAYAASHDLQEPLRMVSSYLMLIEDRNADALDAESREFLEFAIDGADRMRRMIESLLEYSRVDSAGSPLEPVDLGAVFDDVRSGLRLQIEETDATVTAEPLPRVEGDATQLRQLFQNLLQNALEYSGDDPPRVHVAVERTGAKWEVAVRDEGIGISKEEQDSIFELFERLHSYDEHSGTGLGLALCKRIVERHDGRIWVDSEPGEGSTFRFTLPAIRDEYAADE